MKVEFNDKDHLVILSAAKDLRYLTTEPDPSLRSG
jgi:hypothetical protein